MDVVTVVNLNGVVSMVCDTEKEGDSRVCYLLSTAAGLLLTSKMTQCRTRHGAGEDWIVRMSYSDEVSLASPLL